MLLLGAVTGPKLENYGRTPREPFRTGSAELNSAQLGSKMGPKRTLFYHLPNSHERRLASEGYAH